MTTIRDVQNQALEVRMAQGWKPLSPEQRLLYLVSEVGELTREVLAITDANVLDKEDAKSRLGLEIYDCVWNLCDLANLLGSDLDAAFEQKAALNRTRRW